MIYSEVYMASLHIKIKKPVPATDTAPEETLNKNKEITSTLTRVSTRTSTRSYD